MGARRHGQEGTWLPWTFKKCFCATNVVQSRIRRSIYALFEENVVSFWELRPHAPPSLPLYPTGRLPFLRTPSLPTNGKNPADAHDVISYVVTIGVAGIFSVGALFSSKS